MKAITRFITCLILSLMMAVFQDVSAQQSGSDTGSAVRYSIQDTAKARNWMKLSNRTLSGNQKLSLMYADSAYKVYKQLNNRNGMGDALVRMGLARNAMGDYSDAIRDYQTALEHFRVLKNQGKEGKVLNNIGYSQMQMGKYPEAISNYLLSLDIRRKLNDSFGMAVCYTNVGIVFALKNDLAQAKDYFQKSVDIYRRLGDENMVNKNLLNLGGLYKEKQEYRKSIDMIRQVQPYYKKVGDKGEQARCMYILGGNYEGLKMYDSAYDMFQAALKIYTMLNDKKQITGTRLKLAGLYNKRNQSGLAIDESKNVLEMARSMNARLMEMQSYLEMAKGYANMGNYKEAYDFRLKYEALKDSIFNKENNNKIVELEARYQNKIRQQAIDSLTVNQHIAELELKKKKTFNYFLTGILILLSLFSILVYNLYRRNVRANRELKTKNKIIADALGEKEILLREIHHRVKNNLQFIWSMFNLQARHVKDKEALNALTEGKNRVKTMALLHQKLYMHDNLTGIAMQDYVPGLISNIFETCRISQSDADLVTEIDPVILDIDTAIPIGLIMNELITNSLKHATGGQTRPRIRIELVKTSDGGLKLLVMDNGPGLKKKQIPDDPETFGLKLVKSLAKQIKAEVNWIMDNGFGAEISIPLTVTKKYAGTES